MIHLVKMTRVFFYLLKKEAIPLSMLCSYVYILELKLDSPVRSWISSMQNYPKSGDIALTENLKKKTVNKKELSQCLTTMEMLRCEEFGSVASCSSMTRE